MTEGGSDLNKNLRDVIHENLPEKVESLQASKVFRLLQYLHDREFALLCS